MITRKTNKTSWKKQSSLISTYIWENHVQNKKVDVVSSTRVLQNYLERSSSSYCST